MANIVKPISTSDDLSPAEGWYLTVRCTNTACTRLIAFQKAIYRGNHLNLRLAITGEPRGGQAAIFVSMPRRFSIARTRSMR